MIGTKVVKAVILLLILGVLPSTTLVMPVSATPDFVWAVCAAEEPTILTGSAGGDFYQENGQQYMRVDVNYGIVGWSILWTGVIPFAIGKEFDIVESDAPSVVHHVDGPWWTNPFVPIQGEQSCATGPLIISPIGMESFYVICQRIDYGSDIAWSQLGAVLYTGYPVAWDYDFQVLDLPGDAGISGDAGDTFNDATPISLGHHGGGADKDNDPDDYYRFNVDSGRRLYIGMTPPSPYDYDLYLYDPAGTLKASSANTGSASEYIQFDTDSSGDWRVRIRVWSYGGVGLYSFYVSAGGGGGCPVLSVYNGTGYVEEGLLDIHNPDDIDEITSHTLIHTPGPVENRYLLRLTEHPQTYSHLDQVRLFAMLTNGTEVKLPLVSAIHSEDGTVKQELLVSDDVRAVMLGEDWNNGTSQYIDLKFVAPEELEIETFTFIIEGHNKPLKIP
ncbi:MAG: pre-peptidase C-terminal domain-containing protein [Candidatus Bathyarchaeota archaeon]|nr:MAG: pre-peptidase C-terminal domain-containing protein [Candidatus Bathyarchaeota archaeon]